MTSLQSADRLVEETLDRTTRASLWQAWEVPVAQQDWWLVGAGGEAATPQVSLIYCFFLWYLTLKERRHNSNGFIVSSALTNSNNPILRRLKPEGAKLAYYNTKYPVLYLLLGEAHI